MKLNGPTLPAFCKPLKFRLAGRRGTVNSFAVSPYPPSPVKLRERLSETIRHFDAWSVRRGKEYFDNLRVQQVRNQPGGAELTRFAAKVSGSRLYSVKWWYDDGHWWNKCSCPVRADCKHTYAAACEWLETTTGADARSSPGGGAAAKSIKPLSPAEAELIGRLEEAHRRTLSSKEKRFVSSLFELWNTQRSSCSVHLYNLEELGIRIPAGVDLSYSNIMADSWNADEPLESPLELWQHLALFAEKNKGAIPALMEPLTDTLAVKARMVARERTKTILHWRNILEHEGGAPETVAASSPPRELRLRLTPQKLTWESRTAPDLPWQPCKTGAVKQWFNDAAVDPSAFAPSALALLQEVQLGHKREWSASEPQTLRIQESRTRALLRWLLVHPSFRSMVVNAEGSAFDPEIISLTWRAVPRPEDPNDLIFSLVKPDGTPPPSDLEALGGNPALGLAGRSVFRFPAALAHWHESTLVLPREALTAQAAARLARRGVTTEGLDLPAIETIPLEARLVCRVVAAGAEQFEPAHDSLQVELLAASRDETFIRRHMLSRWTTLKSPVADDPVKNVLREYEDVSAEGPLQLLTEFGLVWSENEKVWTRRASAKSFPEDFAAWAESVHAAGVALVCDPALAGLARPADLARVTVQASPVTEAGGSIDWFDLQVIVRAEDTSLSEEEIQLLLRARGRFVRLAGKGWRRLNLQLDGDEAARLAELGLNPDELEGTSERQRFHALQLADERIAGLLPEAHAEAIRECASRVRQVAAPPLPPALNATLRPYQMDGYHFLVHLSLNGLGGILADDMGLGKTVQALAWLLWLANERATQQNPAPLRVLIVCPKSVVANWQAETARFASTLSIAPLRSGEIIPSDVHLIVVNYTQLRLASTALCGVGWDAVVLDEGQNIKNPQSQTARVARDLRAANRVVLTGTPIENRVLDLWSLFAFAMPGLLGSQAAFKRTFNDRVDPLARNRLARRVRHFMLRRTKSQVASDLPPRIEEDLFVELEGAQRKLYDAELKRARALALGVSTSRDFDRNRFNILQSLLRLRQICCDPRLVGVNPEEGKPKRRSKKEELVEPASEGVFSSAKLEALLDTIEPLIEEGHRVLIFSQFVSLLQLLSTELTARDIRHLTLTGKTENRQELIDRFQSAEGEPVFLLSLKAAGSGLNLTAASYVVLMDPWWNPAVEAQAIDRTHRIGQKNQVIAYRLLARGTIEEKIRLLQKAKAELAQAIVHEESLSTVLSIEDIRFVLGE